MESLSDRFSVAISTIGHFEKNPTLAIAVSGGIDSMALLLLAAHWAKTHDGRVIALTVDHGLRPESSLEAQQVKAWCDERRIEHHTLTWHSSGVTTAIQAQARDARYQLLAGWCKSHHVLHLLTAHHRDDQAETLLFRLARGSHIDGLAAMPAATIKHGIRLLRPLLTMPKSALENFLHTEKQAWVHDPSNDKTYYTRNAIRAQLTSGLCEHAADLTGRIGVLRNQWESETAKAVAGSCEIFPQGYAILLEKPFRHLSPDIALRIISSLIQTIGGEPYAARTEKLERLRDEIKAGAIKTKRSFGGCILHYQPKKSHFLIYREAKALDAKIIINANRTYLWDKRFSVSFTTSNPLLTSLTVRALGDSKGKLPENHLKSTGFQIQTKAILPLLPSFWNLEQLVSVPHIGYTDANWRQVQCHAQFTPAKALAGHAFSSKNGNNEILRRKAV